MSFHTDDYRVSPKTGNRAKVNLSKILSLDDAGLSSDRTVDQFEKTRDKLIKLQEKLYVDGRYGLLIVLQGMDGSGKDSTTRHVLRGVNPQGCHVTSFKAPSAGELTHDYLWRIHAAVPGRGQIGVFNRSHYEDVLITRVKKLVPRNVWKHRFDHIRDFESMLHDEGICVVKFYLHISRKYQKERMMLRLQDPEKNWKFNPADLIDRARWGEYLEAYQDAIASTSTRHAPWYIVPAEDREFRNLLVTRVLVETLEALDLHYPKPDFDPKKIVIH